MEGKTDVVMFQLLLVSTRARPVPRQFVPTGLPSGRSSAGENLLQSSPGGIPSMGRSRATTRGTPWGRTSTRGAPSPPSSSTTPPRRTAGPTHCKQKTGGDITGIRVDSWGLTKKHFLFRNGKEKVDLDLIVLDQDHHDCDFYANGNKQCSCQHSYTGLVFFSQSSFLLASQTRYTDLYNDCSGKTPGWQLSCPHWNNTMGVCKDVLGIYAVYLYPVSQF